MHLTLAHLLTVLPSYSLHPAMPTLTLYQLPMIHSALPIQLYPNDPTLIPRPNPTPHTNRCLLNAGAIPAAMAVMSGIILLSGGFHFPHVGYQRWSAATRPTFGHPPKDNSITSGLNWSMVPELWYVCPEVQPSMIISLCLYKLYRKHGLYNLANKWLGKHLWVCWSCSSSASQRCWRILY